ncbi:MAG: hypothetical protein ABSF26_30670 [Thermoguttaceae bacterium]|jgi:hypothetical protein
MATAAELAHRQAIEAGHWILFNRTFRPPADQVLKAKKSVQKALGNRRRGQRVLKTTLCEELEREGHHAAAAQWALFDLVRAELLLVVPPPGVNFEDGYTPDYSISAVGDAWKWTPQEMKRTFDPDKAPPLVVPSGQGRLTVTRWSKLGIGIHVGDGDPRYFGICPHPDNHAVFPIESATELHLPDQWKVLLELLAKSENGNSAKKSDVLFGLGKLNREVFARIADSDIVDADRLTEMKNEAFGKLTGIVSNLARRLRDQVNGPQDKNGPAVLSVDSVDYVESLFVVRHLVAGSDGKLRFGESRNNPRPPLRSASL